MLISLEYTQTTGIQYNDSFPIPDRIPRGCQGVLWGPVFKGCINIATLNIGNNVKVIPSYAFYNCISLTGGVTIPNAIASIGCTRVPSGDEG